MHAPPRRLCSFCAVVFSGAPNRIRGDLFNPQPSGEDRRKNGRSSSPDGCGLNDSPRILFGVYGQDSVDLQRIWRSVWTEGGDVTTDWKEGTDRHGPIRGHPFYPFDPRFLFSIFGVARLVRHSELGAEGCCQTFTPTPLELHDLRRADGVLRYSASQRW